MTETVFICEEWQPPTHNHYHATGEWDLAGVVEEKKDAELWMEGFEGTEEKNRRYSEVTLNHVEAFYTKQ